MIVGVEGQSVTSAVKKLQHVHSVPLPISCQDDHSSNGGAIDLCGFKLIASQDLL